MLVTPPNDEWIYERRTVWVSFLLIASAWSLRTRTFMGNMSETIVHSTGWGHEVDCLLQRIGSCHLIGRNYEWAWLILFALRAKKSLISLTRFQTLYQECWRDRSLDCDGIEGMTILRQTNDGSRSRVARNLG